MDKKTVSKVRRDVSKVLYSYDIKEFVLMFADNRRQVIKTGDINEGSALDRLHEKIDESFFEPY